MTTRVRRRAVAAFAGGFGLVLALGGPLGGAAKTPPADRTYSLVGSSWALGVFSTGTLQEPDFRIPYTRGNSTVVVRPVVRGDAAWFDPGFIVRDALANPSEDPNQTPEQNKRTQDTSIATYRYPFLARCIYEPPDKVNDRAVAYPTRIFERPDAKDAGFPQPPPPTQYSSGGVFGAVAYGEAACAEDYSIRLRGVDEELQLGAEATPTLRAALLRSETRVFFDGPDRQVGVAQTTVTIKGLNLLGGLLTVDGLTVTAEARATGDPSGASTKAATTVVGAAVQGIPVEIRRDGVVVQSTAFSTEAQRRAAQEAVNQALASQNLRVVALGVDESVGNGGEDVTVVGGGIRVE